MTLKNIDMPPLEAVRRTLVEITTPALDIFKETELTPSWQQSFRDGRVQDPGYMRICTLIRWLHAKHGLLFLNNIFAVSEEEGK